MAKLSKRVKAFRERVDKDKHYSIEDAVGILTELSKVKFKESLDISVNLGVDPRKSVSYTHLTLPTKRIV